MLAKTRLEITQRLEAAGVPEQLRLMEQDSSLHTKSSYSANTALYEDNQIPFVDKHLAYLINHPKVDYRHYLSNLRLMLKVRK